MKPNGKKSGQQVEIGQADNSREQGEKNQELAESDNGASKTGGRTSITNNAKQSHDGGKADKNQDSAQAENRAITTGGNTSMPNRKRQIHDDPGNEPRVKRYRFTKKGPDKNKAYDKGRQNRTQGQEYESGVYDICMKDLKKHTGRPPGAERKGRASASGRAPDS